MDNGDAGIWVWCGRKSNPKEKKEAMGNATVSVPRSNAAGAMLNLLYSVAFCSARKLLSKRSFTDSLGESLCTGCGLSTIVCTLFG